MTTTLGQHESRSSAGATLPAGHLAPWQLAPLGPPPRRTRRRWLAVIGPGLLLAGSAVGAGEWLLGPAVTAQYGGTLLWLATISIVVQVCYNLEVIRYTLYCGEPIFVGFFRTTPGPRLWALVYITLFLAHIWPFMAANAAVPLAAALLGHLPGDATTTLLGLTCTEAELVKLLGFAVFGVCLSLLVFGGTVYRLLEGVMTFKLVVLLSFLLVVNALFVSWANVREVLTGFFRFGQIPLRAETIAAGPDFFLVREHDGTRYRLQGTVVSGQAQVAACEVAGAGAAGEAAARQVTPETLEEAARTLAGVAVELCRPGRFTVAQAYGSGELLVQGSVEGSRWRLEEVVIREGSQRTAYAQLADVPAPARDVAAALVANQGFTRESLGSYWAKHRQLPDLNWGMVAAFAAIAGAGGLSNALFSNYARDKGWGMGATTGAIPSAIGGRQVVLSPVGCAFPLTPENLAHWRGWWRHVVRDQVGVWMTCSFVGLALPCMLSLEFIRNAPVSGIRVAAMTAEGISAQFPAWANGWWSLTLFVSFLALAPNSIMTGDLIARMWTDLLWVGSPRVRQLGAGRVSLIYYALLGLFAVWGMFALAWLDPLQITTLGAVLGNVALGLSALHTLYVNRTLLPPEIRPGPGAQLGLVACGVFFLSVTALAIWAP